MSNPGDTIQEYIKKVLKIQEEQKERPLNVEEMQKIAEELGMSPEDLSLIKQKIKDYIARGKGYSRYEDWDSAIDEFRQAVILNPGSIDALYGLANAYKHRWLLKRNKDDLQMAKSYVKRALQVDATHDPSFELASELNRGTAKYTKTSTFKNFQIDFTNFGKEANQVKDVFSKEIAKLDGNKRLKKSSRDKKIFGVCAGIAEYFGVDPTWIRIAFILGALLGTGMSIPLYILLAFIMPKY